MFVFPSELHQAVIVQCQPGCFVKKSFVRRTRGKLISARVKDQARERQDTPGTAWSTVPVPALLPSVNEEVMKS